MMDEMMPMERAVEQRAHTQVRPCEENGNYPLPAEQVNLIAELVQQMLAPVVTSIAKALDNNTKAMEQMASAQMVQNDRLDALEKQVRLNTPVTAQQAKYLSNAIKDRARKLLADRKFSDDKKAVTKLSGMIRKGLMAYYGITAMAEIPRHEYKVALGWIEMWNDFIKIMDVVKDAKKRIFEGLADIEPAEGMVRKAQDARMAGERDQQGMHEDGGA